jgi:hypothetical protein
MWVIFGLSFTTTKHIGLNIMKKDLNVCKKLKLSFAMTGLMLITCLTATTSAIAGIQLVPIGSYQTGVFANGAAEIVSHDTVSQQLFVVNADSQSVDAIDISDPTNPTLAYSFSVAPYGEQANSVAVKNGVVVAAVEANPKQDPGKAVFFDAATGNFINSVMVGALPDMIVYTPDGSYVLVANEGEPNDDYTNDPEGSVSIIDLTTLPASNITQANVSTADFTAFNDKRLDRSVNIYGPGATVAQDLEPEYITVYSAGNGPKKWRAAVTLQENNAIATINVAKAKVIDIVGLGFKDHSEAKNALDASNKDSAIRIKQWPVYGMYQPDSIASYTVGNRVYLVTANEGDSRDYSGFSEETRVKDVTLDSDSFPNALSLQDEANLGRLKITTTRGDFDHDGDFDALFSYGARSFSIWTKSGKLVYDSGSDVGHITASQLPENFNSDDEENSSFDDRSDDKGAEVEGIAVGEVNRRVYSFAGLERTGGIVVYDITNPKNPFFIQYINTRDFDVVAGPGSGRDLSPEGLAFISAADSPNGNPLLVVSYEVSGSTTIFQIND